VKDVEVGMVIRQDEKRNSLGYNLEDVEVSRNGHDQCGSCGRRNSLEVFPTFPTDKTRNRCCPLLEMVYFL
jgi:hypothetical protein